MRVLQDTAVGFTGNQVAREARMHPRSALKALTALEELGIVFRQRGGRDHLFTLNREHLLLVEGLLPLLQSERGMIDRFGAALEPILKGRVVAAILFGSVARQEEKPGSDVDLCCIVDDEKSKVAVQDALHANAQHLFRSFGAKISPILFTKRELLRKKRTSLVKAILAEGISVVGEIPREAGRG